MNFEMALTSNLALADCFVCSSLPAAHFNYSAHTKYVLRELRGCRAHTKRVNANLTHEIRIRFKFVAHFKTEWRATMITETKRVDRVSRRLKRYGRMARQATRMQDPQSTFAPDYVALDAAFVVSPQSWPKAEESRRLHQVEIVTDEGGHQFILGLRLHCSRKRWEAVRFQILPAAVNG